MWGSIAAQLGAGRVHVTSIVSSAGADPHDYEPTPADARTMAGARAAIVNGAGYDPWASRLLAASPEGNRVVVNVGDLVGVKAGANPHRWYAPGDVRRVIASVTAAYKRLDPGHAAAFDASRRRFEDIGLAAYRTRIAAIRRRFAGVAVGASESIFAPLAQALGLRLLTPSRFVNAVSEGAEPTAADKTTADRQIATHAIAVWVSNGQNTTPDVQRLDEAARAAGIGVVKVTETITPATATFQDWQVRQLDALARALAKATGR
jgi:zinc/manganese transport system substrate-binding protein